MSYELTAYDCFMSIFLQSHFHEVVKMTFEKLDVKMLMKSNAGEILRSFGLLILMSEMLSRQANFCGPHRLY